MKFISIGMLILILTPVIIGAMLFYFSDWPINIGGKETEHWALAIAPIFVIGIGWLMPRFIGRWAGKMIIDEGKSPYQISLLTLITTFIAMLMLFLNITILTFGVIVSIILARFMGNEIKRKGKLTTQDHSYE